MSCLKHPVYEYNEKLYVHVSFVDVPIPNCIHSLNTLFTIPFYSQAKFWAIPYADFGEAVTQPRTVYCLQGPSAFKKGTWM